MEGGEELISQQVFIFHLLIMNNWIWWVVILVVAVLVDLFAISPLFRYFHHQEALTSPVIRIIGSILKWLADRLDDFWIFFHRIVRRVWKWVQKFFKPGFKINKPASSVILDIPVTTVSDPSGHPVDMPASSSFQVKSLDIEEIKPESMKPPLVQPSSYSHEKLIEIPKGTKVKITVDLSPGQKVQICVESGSKNNKYSDHFQG